MQPILLETKNKKKKKRKKKSLALKMKFNFHNGSKENRRGGFSVAVKIFSAIFAKPAIFLYT